MSPVYEIDREQAEQIINVEEGFLNDVKAKEIKPAKLSETISAFANAGGGDVYIGIAEIGEEKARKWNGFDDVEAANDIIQTLFPEFRALLLPILLSLALGVFFLFAARLGMNL